MKQCRKCDKEKPLDHFRMIPSTGKTHSWCQKCESKYHKERRAGTQIAVIPTTSDAVNPKDAKEIAMKRMLAGAKQRAKDINKLLAERAKKKKAQSLKNKKKDKQNA